MSTTSADVVKPGGPQATDAPVLIVTRSGAACRRMHRQFGEDRTVIAVDAWEAARELVRRLPVYALLLDLDSVGRDDRVLQEARELPATCSVTVGLFGSGPAEADSGPLHGLTRGLAAGPDQVRRLRQALSCTGCVVLRGDQAPPAPGLRPDDLLLVSESDPADLEPGMRLLVSMEGQPVIRRFARYAWRLGGAQLALHREGGWWPRLDHVDWEDLLGVVEAVHRAPSPPQQSEQPAPRLGVEELRALHALTEAVNTGLLVDDVLNRVYDSFRAIIPYDRIGFSLLDEDGAVLRSRWARSQAREMKITTGFSAPMAGSSLEGVLESGSPRIIDDLEAYLRSKPASLSTQLIVEEGMRSSLTCPLVANGRPVGFMFFSSMEKATYRDAHVEIFRHIAGELATIVEKARLYQKLLELNDLKDRFLGIAAHDLRNPIAIVDEYSKLLLRGRFGEIGERQKKVLELFPKVCARMLHLIDGLLSVRALEAGKLDMKLAPLDVGALVRECAAAYGVLAASRRIRVVTDVEDGLPPALTDSNRVSEVLSNLFDNAVKFSGPETAVTLHARREEGFVRVEVVDQGPGIPEDEVGRLFNEFSRASTKPTGGERSTGLGLAIVKRIVEALGGVVGVETRPGVGSCFSFTLPLAGGERN